MPAKREQLVSQGCGALCRFLYFLDVFAKCGVRGQSFLDEFAVPDDYTEKVVKVVSDSAGQAANGFHLLCLHELLFQALAFRDVLSDSHHSDEIPFAVLDLVCGQIRWKIGAILSAMQELSPPFALFHDCVAYFLNQDR